MNRDLYSAVRHANLLLASPLPLTAYEPILNRVLGRAPGSVVDIGCGRAALLAMFAARGWSCVGVDRSELMCNAAIEHARTACPSQPVQIVHGDAAQVIGAMSKGSQACAICIGSSHALGGLEPTLSEMSRVCGPGGDLVVGELYWRTTPPDALLAEIGMASADLSSLQGTVAAGEKLGVTAQDCITATPDQFRSYELTQFESGMRWARLNPHHPDAEAILQRTQWWWNLYSRFADDWFGFAVFAYSKLG